MPDQLYNFWKDLIFRRRLFFAVAFAVLAVGLAVQSQLPRVFKSEVWLLLETVPTNTPATRPAEELEIMERHLLSSAALLQAANDASAYPELDDQTRVAQLRSDIQTRRLIGGNRASLLHISVLHAGAETSARISTALAAQSLAFDLSRQTRRSDQLTGLAQDRVTKARAQVAELDGQILALRQQAAQALPDTLQARMSERLALQSQQWLVAQQMLALQMSTEETGPSAAETLYLQLERAQQEKARAAALSQPDNKRLELLETRIANLQLQLAAVTSPSDRRQAQLTLLNSQERAIQASLDKLEESLNATPRHTGRLEALMRDRDLAELRLKQAQSDLYDARAWQQALATGAARRWSLTDMPFAPETPEGPDEGMLIAAILFAAIASAGGAVFLASRFDDRVTSARQIAEVLGTAPLLELPATPFRNLQQRMGTTG